MILSKKRHEQKNEIEYLYHYTSIETLALILKTRKFKFNRLDNVNDPLDGITEDFPDSKKIVYAACFTARDDDSIPMWSIYTKNMNGIRIKFHWSLFGSLQKNLFSGQWSKEINGNPFNEEESLLINGPTRINYLKSSEEIKCKTIIEHKNGISEFYPFRIGENKIKDWIFEDEVRFRVFSFNAVVFGREMNHLTFKMSQIDDYVRDDIPYLLLDLDEKAFDEVEILLGPKTNEAHKITVKALIEKYAPKAVIKKSEKRVK